MDRIIYSAAYILLITGFFMSLYSIAQDSSEKVIQFSNSIDKAIDCATQGISIYKCAPELSPNKDYKANYELSFRSNLNKTIKTIQSFNQKHQALENKTITNSVLKNKNIEEKSTKPDLKEIKKELELLNEKITILSKQLN